MGCGASSNVVPAAETANGHSKINANGTGNGHTDHHDDDLPTVVLPETPIKPKAPIAFEIPLEEFEGGRRASSPPRHLQRLLQPPVDITLPYIEEKLAEAEQRRQSILQQRAASAQKRTQKMLKTAYDIDRAEKEHEHEGSKYGQNTLTIPPEPGVCEDKNIT